MFKNVDGSVRSSSNLTPHQIALYNWICYYDWIMSGKGPETPDEYILENDEALDRYVEDWKRSLKEKRTPNKGDTKSFNIE